MQLNCEHVAERSAVRTFRNTEWVEKCDWLKQENRNHFMRSGTLTCSELQIKRCLSADNEAFQRSLSLIYINGELGLFVIHLVMFSIQLHSWVRAACFRMVIWKWTVLMKLQGAKWGGRPTKEPSVSNCGATLEGLCVKRNIVHITKASRHVMHILNKSTERQQKCW